MEYKVTIITPCYNISKLKDYSDNFFIKNFISVKNQTIKYENIEHIFVDDCSTDNTFDLLRDLSKKYSNIKLFRTNENTGSPSIPRNIGIKKATSKYVMFLDQDDYLEENSVEILYNTIKNNNVNLVSSNYYSYDGIKKLKHKSFNHENLYVSFNDEKLIDFMTYLQTKIFDVDFLKKNNIHFPNSYNEDVYFYILNLCFNKKDVIILNNFYSFVYNSNNQASISRRFNKRILFDYVDRFTDSMDLLLDEKMNIKFIVDFHKNNLISIMSTLLLSKETKNMNVMFKKSRDYFLKYDFLEFQLGGYWKICYNLIYTNHIFLFKCVMYIIQMSFENSLFKKFFRNKNYEC
ncbi:glycosyltransferase family 2 protein [Methanosphaera sp. ISO3-F5]|uniref:glycosyltransferase family 2 protein n=1 Tax=Methanosphaera sp. ISO3-F5 TaxID=1452353 RepID=UPI002B262BF5|nr:glycosyltransferase family 2 protein [Methanosphaera sp. ISO3-F5]WQH63410.1 glycosyltransferase family 2 protein [Methanosphaera sp. ISO3-F5]